MFRILIEEIRTVEKDIGHKWVGNRDGAQCTESGYTPSHMAPVEETVKRYEQHVGQLSVSKVVAVVNGLAHLTEEEMSALIQDASKAVALAGALKK